MDYLLVTTQVVFNRLDLSFEGRVYLSLTSHLRSETPEALDQKHSSVGSLPLGAATGKKVEIPMTTGWQHIHGGPMLGLGGRPNSTGWSCSGLQTLQMSGLCIQHQCG